MRVAEEFNYGGAKEILESKFSGILKEIIGILTDPNNKINLSTSGSQRDLSIQIESWFANKGWQKEKTCFSIKEFRYDLAKDNIVIEVELGHQRLVYADFFKFMMDHYKGYIPAGIMIVTGDPNKFGHTWHNSLDSTRKKILAIKEVFHVPILVIAVNP